MVKVEIELPEMILDLYQTWAEDQNLTVSDYIQKILLVGIGSLGKFDEQVKVFTSKEKSKGEG